MFKSLTKSLAVVALCLLGYTAAQRIDSTVPAQNATFQGKAIYRQGFDQNLYKFVFPQSNANNAPGGSTNTLTINSNPSTYDQGIGQNLVTMNPRTFVTPHYHPRSTEVAHVIKGILEVDIVEEQDGRAEPVRQTVYPGQSIYFPQGYLHTIRNEGLEQAQFIASFSNPDFGTMFLHNKLFAYGPAIIAQAYGLSLMDAEKFVASALRQGAINPIRIL